MTTPMESMRNPVPPSLEPAQIVLVRKIILLGLLMIVAALGLVLLLRHIHIYSLIFPHILSDAAMGLIAGVSARWVLRNQTVFLRIISILAFLIGGLELLGWFTGWQIGFGPLKFGLSSVDWSSLGQLLLAAGVSLLSPVRLDAANSRSGPALPWADIKQTSHRFPPVIAETPPPGSLQIQNRTCRGT